MMWAGYDEKFWKNILLHASRIFNDMKEKDKEGIRPIYREKEFCRVDRKKAKKGRKHSWSTNRGYTVPVMVSSTPNGELARILREVVENEQQEGIKFKIVETGGITVKSRLIQPDCHPWLLIP